jgi:prevent-host-death family protein
MITISRELASKDLGILIDHVIAGEEIVITNSGTPVARLVPVPHMRTERTPGRLKGLVDLPDSLFFDPLPESELQVWGGEGDKLV